jgi:hypothetical protein
MSVCFILAKSLICSTWPVLCGSEAAIMRCEVFFSTCGLSIDIDIHEQVNIMIEFEVCCLFTALYQVDSSSPCRSSVTASPGCQSKQAKLHIVDAQPVPNEVYCQIGSLTTPKHHQSTIGQLVEC